MGRGREGEGVLHARNLFILAPFFLILTTSMLLWRINFSWFLFSAASGFAFLLAATGKRSLLAAAFFVQIATALLDPQQLLFTSVWYLLLHLLLSITLLVTALAAEQLSEKRELHVEMAYFAPENEVNEVGDTEQILEAQLAELLDENAHLEEDNRELLLLLNKQLGVGRPVRRSILKKKKR